MKFCTVCLQRIDLADHLFHVTSTRDDLKTTVQLIMCGPCETKVFQYIADLAKQKREEKRRHEANQIES